MPRTVIIHLSVEVPDEDVRTPDELADMVEIALANGLDENPLAGLEVHCPLAEEV